MDRSPQFHAIAKYVAENGVAGSPGVIDVDVVNAPSHTTSDFTRMASDIDRQMRAIRRHLIALDECDDDHHRRDAWTAPSSSSVFQSISCHVQIHEGVRNDLREQSAKIIALTGVIDRLRASTLPWKGTRTGTVAHAMGVVEIMRQRVQDATDRVDAQVERRVDRASVIRARRSLYSFPSSSSPSMITPIDSSSSDPRSQQQTQSLPDRSVLTREADLTRVHHTIVEIGTMVQRLSSIVSDQSDTVLRIDDDLQHASRNVDRATDQVRRLALSSTSLMSSWLLVGKVVGIVTAFLVVVVVLV